jgi:hypothetical protein
MQQLSTYLLSHDKIKITRVSSFDSDLCKDKRMHSRHGHSAVQDYVSFTDIVHRISAL